MNETVSEPRTPPPPPEPESDLPHMADRLRADLRADLIFGQPIRDREVTVVPVAKVGGGMGGGRGPQGRGGGLGISVKPAGFIVMDKDGVRYRRIDYGGPLAALLAAAVVLLLAPRRRRRS